MVFFGLVISDIRCQISRLLQESMRGAEFFSCPVSIALVFCFVFINILDMFNTYYLQK